VKFRLALYRWLLSPIAANRNDLQTQLQSNAKANWKLPAKGEQGEIVRRIAGLLLHQLHDDALMMTSFKPFHSFTHEQNLSMRITATWR